MKGAPLRTLGRREAVIPWTALVKLKKPNASLAILARGDDPSTCTRNALGMALSAAFEAPSPWI